MPPEKKVITKEFVHKVSSFSVELECLWKKVLQIIDFFIIILMVNNSVQTVLYVKKKKNNNNLLHQGWIIHRNKTL